MSYADDTGLGVYDTRLTFPSLLSKRRSIPHDSIPKLYIEEKRSDKL
jgi:hypothetical protein